ncbi:MAG: hydroxylamine oxidoreductase [Planctomycetes bacterium]|nr:hydroxylamine oxidoreductase [Planctomycetota bacterium]
MEVARKQREAGLAGPHIAVPQSSKRCVDCHLQKSPGIVEQWRGSTHAEKGVGCVECHQAQEDDADGYRHEGVTIATIVTPRDCSRCHIEEAREFGASHHAAGGNILASLDNILAETVEGARVPFDPHSPTPGRAVSQVNGMASAFLGCMQCHGSKVALVARDGGKITADELKPDASGKPTSLEALGRILKDENGRPSFHPGTWPNTGIGRINLDGSLGACSACHSRHDFSPRRARQPESCGKCHMGPDHPQKEIFEESKHGIAFRDLKDHMHLDAGSWVLGKDYSQAPTCATCHMSGNTQNEGRITHDPGERISWTNRPPVSLVMDTDLNGKIVKEADPQKRATLVKDSWEKRRGRMKEVCSHCHTNEYINAFYQQYDDLVILYNEKFAKPGQAILGALLENGLLTKKEFDEEIEWTWYLLWHHEGRRARMGASMMGPDFTHWHGMFEVAERFYRELIPQALEITARAAAGGQAEKSKAVNALIDGILARPEHAWSGMSSTSPLAPKSLEAATGGGK